MKNRVLRQRYKKDEDYAYARKIRNQIKKGLLPRWLSGGTTLLIKQRKGYDKTEKAMKRWLATYRGNKKFLCTIDVFVQGRSLEAQ